MTQEPAYTFVLWGKRFDEAVAALFVTELRDAGLRVKVVGLDGGKPVGLHGLALVPDLTLTQAQGLSQQIICIILPCSPTEWHRVSGDPRVGDLFQEAQFNGAQLVSRQNDGLTGEVGNSLGYALPLENAINYPEDEALLPFIRGLIKGIKQLIRQKLEKGMPKVSTGGQPFVVNPG